MASPLQQRLGCVLAGKSFSLPRQGLGLCGRPVTRVLAAKRDLFFGTTPVSQGAVDTPVPVKFPGPVLSQMALF